MLVQENQRLSMELKDVQAQVAMLKKELNKEMIQADAEQVQGRYWLPEEHRRFLVGLKKYGHKNIKAIAAYVGTRSTTQVRSHAQKYMKKLNRHGKTLADLGLPEKSDELDQEDEAHPAMAVMMEESSQTKPNFTPSYDELPLTPPLHSKKFCYDSGETFSSLYAPAADQMLQSKIQSFENQMCSKGMQAMGMAGKDCSSAQPSTVVGMPMPSTNSPSVVLQTSNDISGALRIHKVSWQNVPGQGANSAMFSQLGAASSSFMHPPGDGPVANFGNPVFPMSQLGQQQCMQMASNFQHNQQIGNNLTWLSQQQAGQPMKGTSMPSNNMLSMFQKVTENPMNLQQGRFVL